MSKNKKVLNLIRPVAFFDLETTGANVDTDQIVQYAITRIETDGSRSTIKGLVMPTVPISPEAQEVHGITMEYLKKEKAEPFIQHATVINDFIYDCDLGGYNILKFDIPVLENEMCRAGIEVDFSTRKNLDVFSIVSIVFSKSLDNVYRMLTGDARKVSHEADADVSDTITVLVELLKQALPNSMMNNDELIEYCSAKSTMVDYAGKFYKKDGLVYFNFGTSRGKSVYENPGLLEWMLDKDFPRNTMKWAERLLSEVYGEAEEDKKKIQTGEGKTGIDNLMD